MQCTLYVGNSNLVEVKGLKNAATDSYENGASVNVVLLDEAEQEISGESWPKSLGYVAASDGDYRGTLSEGIAIAHGQIVTAKITATASGLTAVWETPCKAIERT